MTIEERLSLLEQQIAAQVPTPTEYYTSRWSGEEIDNRIASLSNQNLLVNAYFKGGGSQQGGGQFPINQRGQTSYTNAKSIMYGIDMWILDWNVTLTLVSGYVSMNGGGIFQPLPNEKISLITGKTVTLSALDAYGNLSVVTGVYDGVNNIISSDGSVEIRINYGGKTATFWVGRNSVVACKLELGNHQTLAYQDEDGAWQLFETPDYGEELDKCLFYLEIQNIPINAFIPANVWNGSTGECNFRLQYANKRITPTISFPGGGRFISNSASPVNLTSFFTMATPSAAGISATLSENLTGGAAGWVDSLGQVIISAEL